MKPFLHVIIVIIVIIIIIIMVVVVMVMVLVVDPVFDSNCMIHNELHITNAYVYL
jgi:hypothetical protein